MSIIKDLTHGNESKVILQFAIPMILGNLFQQFYNIADTIIVGRFIGAGALAAVGSSYTIMVFLTSIILGLCMGSGVIMSNFFGARELEKMKSSMIMSFIFIAPITALINGLSLVYIDEILHFIQIPIEVLPETKRYLQIIFYGIGFTFIYNYFAAVLRSMGNSVIPLLFLIVSAIINIVLDLIFILPLGMGVGGAALATIIAQGFSAVGLAVYSFIKVPLIRPKFKDLRFNRRLFQLIARDSVLTSTQQSIMNFGILMVQGLVNSFGVSVMAAFAAGVKIDSFAYMPVQDFGNAFSTFIAQNKGAGKTQRIHNGIRSAVKMITLFCIAVSLLVVVFAKPLMTIFIESNETEIIQIGVQYLTIEASFYVLIGFLFMFYGLFRGFGRAGISVVLTIASLGTRVILAYVLSSVPAIGLVGIWWAIPIGWALADIIGYYKLKDIIKISSSRVYGTAS